MTKIKSDPGDKIDVFQMRYQLHQLHKRKQLMVTTGEKPMLPDRDQRQVFSKLLFERRSQRVFNQDPVSPDDLQYILDAIASSPSSCNRQAISPMVIEDRDRKDLLSGILVGGVGWCHRANKIILLFANIEAYKENLPYMPFLDAGVVAMATYLSCETLRIGCCYINPNVRDNNVKSFQQNFSDKLFCGALAIGHYTKKARYSPKVKSEELLL